MLKIWLHFTFLMDFICVPQSALESQVFDERDKAQRLQTELDVSEQVQKDFVKLSQTLQVTIVSLCTILCKIFKGDV